MVYLYWQWVCIMLAHAWYLDNMCFWGRMKKKTWRHNFIVFISYAQWAEKCNLNIAWICCFNHAPKWWAFLNSSSWCRSYYLWPFEPLQMDVFDFFSIPWPYLMKTEQKWKNESGVKLQYALFFPRKRLELNKENAND